MEIHLSIDIKAPASVVWAILIDFGTYKRWNPYIRAILGRPDKGGVLRMTLLSNGQAAMSTSALLTHMHEPRDLRWRYQHLVPGLYTSEHRFRIESLPAGGVRFLQTKQTGGILASFLSTGSRHATEKNFHAMNHALKTRAERLQTQLEVPNDAVS